MLSCIGCYFLSVSALVALGAELLQVHWLHWVLSCICWGVALDAELLWISCFGCIGCIGC